jgi:ribosomal protein L16 Arg81 hydroxylase
MADTPRTLAEALAPITEKEFFDRYLGREFFYSQGRPGKFAGLLPWSDLNRILEHHHLDAPRLRLVREGRTLPAESYSSYRNTRRPSERRPRLRSADLTQRLQEGATLIIDSMDEIHEPVTALAENLERSLQTRVQVNMYAGWRTSRGFDLHWDGHDVLILQVAGRKRWSIYGVTREYPLPGDKGADAKTPPTTPVWEGMLEEGDLLYIPRGWWHVAVPLDEPTLHLTVGLHHSTGMDFLEWFSTRLRDEAVFRQDVPRFGSEGERERHLESMRLALLSAWTPGLLDEYFAYTDTRRAARPHFQLPESVMAPALPEADAGWSVKWMGALSTDTRDGVVRIDCAGKRWTFAGEAAPLLHLLQQRETCAIEDLYSASGAVSADTVRAFIAELLDAGLVAVAHAHSE